MADPNVTEIKELRKRRFFLELIKNTSSCCLNWVRLSVNQNQFKSSKDNFEFILSSIGTGITLDVIKDCRFVASYRSSENADIKTLYDTVVLIQDKQFFIVADEEKKLIEALKRCRCLNRYDELGYGGIVIGGSAEVHMPQRIFEIMNGGVVVQGSSEIHMPDRIFEIMNGGVVVRGSAEVRVPQRIFEIMNGGVVVGGNNTALVIGPDTYIYIWFDNSGSMNSTLTPLTTMKNTLLKDALLPFYDNDSASYDNHVFVQNYPYERTMDVIMRSAISQPPVNPPNTSLADYQFPVDANNVVVLWFQDESSPYGDFTTRNATYEEDIAALRSRIETFTENFYRAVFFQVDYYNLNFRMGLIKIQTSSTPFNVEGSTNYGLGDKSEFVFKYGITDGGTPAYYLEQVLSALEELGFEVR